MKKPTFALIFSAFLLTIGACKTTENSAQKAQTIASDDHLRALQLGEAIVQDLRQDNPKSENQVWFQSKMHLSQDWLLESPEGYWGQTADSLPKNLGCKAEDANCDAEFLRPLCNADSDCSPYNTRCQVLEASVSKPGQTAKKMCLGSGDQLLNRYYRAMVSAKTHLDITTLAMPTGRFYPMLVNALSYLSHQQPSPTIRLLTAGRTSRQFNILNPPQTIIAEIVAEMRKAGADLGRLRLDLGYLATGGLSWNHSKIVIADGKLVISGGHNLYDPDYLEDHPVFDASLEFKGPAAAGVQKFVNLLWSHVASISWGKFPYERSSDLLKKTGWTQISPPTMPPEAAGEINMIGVGRMEGYGESPSDTAFISMLDHAKASVYLVQQDIFSKIPLPVVPDIQQKFNLGESVALPALVKAILRGVQIKIVQTDQVGDGADGYGMMDAQEAQAFIVESLLKEAQKQGVKPADGQSLTQYLCSMFEIAPWRFTASERRWGDNKRKIGSHPKIIIIDQAIFYLGSHNFYPANLQEFGVIVTDHGVTRELLTNYWDKVWSASAPDRIGCDRPDQELLPKPGMFGKSR